MSIFDEKFPSDFNDTEFFSCASRDETISTDDKTISNYTKSSSSFLNQLNTSTNSNERDEFSSSLSSTITGPLSKNEENFIENTKNAFTILSSNDKQRNKIFKKSHSYQDLHSNYTKKKYKHVKSKVRQYIADLQSQFQNQNRNLSNNVYDNCSLQSTCSDSDSRTIFEHQHCLDNIENNKQSSENLTIIRCQKELESLKNSYDDLKRVNVYLQTIHDEKSAQVAQAHRIAESLKIEICNIKERAKFESLKRTRLPRNSLPTSYLMMCGYNQKISTGTQTNDSNILIEPITPKNNQISIDTYLNFTDTLDLLKCSDCNLRTTKSHNSSAANENALRRRSNSNSMKFNKRNSTDLNAGDNSNLTTPINSGNNNGSDSAIEIERSDEMLTRNSSPNNVVFNSPELISSSNKRPRKIRKSKLLRKKYWKSIILSCIRCQVKENNDISYTPIPLSETMFEFKNIH